MDVISIYKKVTASNPLAVDDTQIVASMFKKSSLVVSALILTRHIAERASRDASCADRNLEVGLPPFLAFQNRQVLHR